MSFSDTDGELLESDFQEVINTLAGTCVSTVFAHDWDLLKDADFDVMKAFFQRHPNIQLGASIYDLKSIESIVNMQEYVSIVQLPLNILNQSFIPALSILSDLGIKVWARSVFLQGAIDWNSPLNGFRIHEDVARLQKLGLEYEMSPFALALDFLKRFPVDVLIGVSSIAQLSELIGHRSTNLSDIDYDLYRSSDQTLIDPRNWK